jgi:RNA polymerase-binding transcription factor
MLTTQEKDKLKEVLLAEKARLLKNAQEGLSFSMNRDRNIGRDSIDESMEEELFSTELRLRDREKWLLGKINGALERLEAGTIDECEDCGERIAYKRLVARPVTTLCIDCKEEREKEEQAQAMAVRGRAGDSLSGGESSSTEEPASGAVEDFGGGED